MNDSHPDNYICEDVLINILARLPAKSLVRFLCVSKSWSNLIRSSSFVAAHLNRNVTDYNQYLIAKHFYRVSKGSYLISLFANETFEQCLELQHPLWTNKHFEVYSSCNGLVCISDKDLSSTSPICIWTHLLENLYLFPIPTWQIILVSRKSACHYVLTQNHNDYKVVKMLRICQERSMEVEVYSLVTNSWKMIESTPLLDSLWWLMAHEVCKGIVYWLIYERHHRIVSFDTGSEIFDELLVPDSILPINGFVKIQAYKETICLLQGDTNIDFWVLQEGSFQKLRTIILPGYSPFGLFTDNGLLVQKDSTHTELDLFDLESNQLKDTRILTCDRYKLHAYKGSLVLFDH